MKEIKNVMDYIQIAMSSVQKKDYRNAIYNFGQELKINPNNEQVNGFIQVLRKLWVEDLISHVKECNARRDYEGAIKDLEELLLFDPNNSDVKKILADMKAYVDAGKKKELVIRESYRIRSEIYEAMCELEDEDY